MKRILFVCTGNSCRSVMAEGLFRKMTAARPGEFSVMSAGISAVDGFPATEETVKAMREEGIDVSAHRSRRLRPEMIRTAARIFVMEEIHREWILSAMPESAGKVSLLSEFLPQDGGPAGYRDVPDPIRMSSGFYKDVLDVIRRCLETLIEKL